MRSITDQPDGPLQIYRLQVVGYLVPSLTRRHFCCL